MLWGYTPDSRYAEPAAILPRRLDNLTDDQRADVETETLRAGGWWVETVPSRGVRVWVHSDTDRTNVARYLTGRGWTLTRETRRPDDRGWWVLFTLDPAGGDAQVPHPEMPHQWRT